MIDQQSFRAKLVSNPPASCRGAARQSQGSGSNDARERLQVRPLRRFVRTTQSDHQSPIFLNLMQEFTPTGPDQAWVADLTYIAITTGFVYVAVILDAWSRRVVGYALSRRIDTRLALAALRATIDARNAARLHPSFGPGWTYASAAYRQALHEYGLRVTRWDVAAILMTMRRRRA